MAYFCKKSNQLFLREEDSLVSPLERIGIQKVDGIEVPVFSKQKTGANEFSMATAAELHKNAMNWLHQTHGTTDRTLRETLVASIPLDDQSQHKIILVTGCGEGKDLPYLFERYPDATFYIQDIALEMLSSAIENYSRLINAENVFFWLGDACDLPFKDNFFDLVYHFGGINLFSSPKKGVEEMHRVGKIGAAILFGDEGVAPFLHNSEIAKVLIKNNPLYNCSAPINYIPSYVTDFKLQYLFNNCFYLVTYRKSDSHNINLDVKHLGRRGGSLRTRYYGELDGIDPGLRRSVYELAEKLGLSHVELLERLLSQGIKDKQHEQL
jgi:ubiquinone/menaquinone biosynthesis C-methylase UbiE